MKKWTIWIIVIIVFLLLVTRLIYWRFDNLKSERAWYISELHYDFSARVDSIVRPGRAIVTIIHGNFDPNREWQLKDGLKYHGILHLLISREVGYDLRVPLQTSLNDSLHIDSDVDQFSLYRHGKLVVSRPLSEFLRVRPF